jgi:hypothetical protein
MFGKGLGANARSYINSKKKSKKTGAIADPRRRKMLRSINRVGYMVTEGLPTQEEVEELIRQTHASQSSQLRLRCNSTTDEITMTNRNGSNVPPTHLEESEAPPISWGPDEMLYLESHTQVMEVNNIVR